MGDLILCSTKKAAKPYYMESLGKNISSIEELCFFLYYHTHLLDERIMKSELVEWISKQLGLTELAGQLEEIRTNRKGVEEFVITILRDRKYCPAEELDEYYRELKHIGGATPFDRKKRKADYLVKTKNYYGAIREYRFILKDCGQADGQFLGSIYHNLGVAYARMYVFDHAKDAFLRAFSLQPNQKSLKLYKLALRLSGSNETEDEAARSFPASATLDVSLDEELNQQNTENNQKVNLLRELEELKQESNMKEYYEKLEQILHQWQDECRRYMNC